MNDKPTIFNLLPGWIVILFTLITPKRQLLTLTEIEMRVQLLLTIRHALPDTKNVFTRWAVNKIATYVDDEEAAFIKLQRIGIAAIGTLKGE